MTHGDAMRWMYHRGRPNRVAAVLNRVSAVLHSAGIWPRRLATLKIIGRRSGRMTSFPVVIAEYQGERYLVAMLGDSANWVANLRAAGGLAVLSHGRNESVRTRSSRPAHDGANSPALSSGRAGRASAHADRSPCAARRIRTHRTALPRLPHHPRRSIIIPAINKPIAASDGIHGMRSS